MPTKQALSKALDDAFTQLQECTKIRAEQGRKLKDQQAEIAELRNRAPVASNLHNELRRLQDVAQKLGGYEELAGKQETLIRRLKRQIDVRDQKLKDLEQEIQRAQKPKAAIKKNRSAR